VRETGENKSINVCKHIGKQSLYSLGRTLGLQEFQVSRIFRHRHMKMEGLLILRSGRLSTLVLISVTDWFDHRAGRIRSMKNPNDPYWDWNLRASGL
jgi:hypothetical protein